MENFFVFLIFFIMVIGPIIRFYNRWKNSRTDSLKNDLPRQEYIEGEFYPADQPRSANPKDGPHWSEPQPSEQVITFEEYVFFLDGTNQQVGDRVTTSLSGAQSTAEQYAEKNKKAVNIYKFVAGNRIWIDKVYPHSASSSPDGVNLLR
jgi:hypothetical protein